ncbi:E3 ubiquitin-protein like [Actinidia chinensis var. chinensis]|uniref:RING-type E3 ubiquitin transferase n=1 Tax=Actinidia chinensis var. chinensis TaxID=1590841 RepID=A0A2R6QTZ5_ACTCC|nr:E3 ubiquitin-protein like [Actinidia chinensis var. chinensis]
MEEGIKSENHMTSAAAFVEGGIQEACDDTCSICLEAFCESDPSTVTGCKHEFHLQCILEWCQRSSQCPMCWQSISLKDPSSQELLDAIEREKNFRINPHRNTTIFHHPTLGDFELQHLPVSATDTELEERIIQHLAAAAAMGRARRITRRDDQRSRSSTQGRPHFLVFSAHPNGPPVASVSSSATQRGEGESTSAVAVAGPTTLITVEEDSAQLVPPPTSQANRVSASASGSSVLAASHHETSSNNQRSPTQTSPTGQDRAGPSEFQSFSDSMKSRFNALSLRYKESITKSTRGWKERLFSRNTNTADLGSEVRREVKPEIATSTGSCMMDRPETIGNSRTNTASSSNNLRDGLVPDPGNQQTSETGGSNSLNEGNTQASCASGSASN